MDQEKPGMLQAALIGGVFLGVTSALPVIGWFNCGCCLLLVGGGTLASFIYFREHSTGTTATPYGDGALLGLFTGGIGAVVWTMVEIPVSYFKLRFGVGMGDLAELEELLSDPEIPPIVNELLMNILADGAFSPILVFFTLITHLILAAVFATIGGVIGAALFQPAGSNAYRGPAPPASPPTVGPGKDQEPW